MEDLFMSSINNHNAKDLLEYDLTVLAGGIIQITDFFPFRPNDFTYCVHSIEFSEKTKTLLLGLGAWGYPESAEVLELKNPKNISIQNNIFSIKSASEIRWQGKKHTSKGNGNVFVLEIS